MEKPDDPNVRFGVFQLGARRHYIVPRILESAGMLQWLLTDLCNSSWPISALDFVPGSVLSGGLRRLRDRKPTGIPSSKITSFPRFGLKYSRRLPSVSRSRHWVAGGQEFCRLVLTKGLKHVDGVYGFTAAALEVLLAAKCEGKAGILDQIMAPRAIENDLLRQEHSSFPGWGASEETDEDLARYCDREQAEWQAADLIICGSEFVRESVLTCGGSPDRCVTIPYGVSVPIAPRHHEQRKGPLRVLTVGELGLRKGTPWVLEAARRLKGKVQFRLVGAFHGSDTIFEELRQHCELTGVVPRSDVASHLGWADVFLLPSLCEGSSGAVFEAIAAGLPVVCTHNTGSVITHGQDGFIVPIRDYDAIVEALTLLGEQDRLGEMSREAHLTAERWSMDSYARRLCRQLRQEVLKC
jgi:glycosyltransferase involved in cell wall biosynthesis